MLLQIPAILSLLPACLLLLRPHPKRDLMFWVAMALAVAGPVVVVLQQNLGGWLPSLSGALWASVAAAMILFAVIAALNDTAWRLLPLLAIYGLVMAIGGALFATVPIEHLQATNSAAWLDLHIVVSVATYGLATIAAVAGSDHIVEESAVGNGALKEV